MYSVTDEQSLREAEQHVKTIKQITMKEASIMLVANKVDDAKHRTVSLEEGQKLASTLECSHIELSVLYDESKAKSIFYELSHEILQKRGLMSKTQYRHTPNMVRRVFQALTNNGPKGRRSMTYL